MATPAPPSPERLSGSRNLLPSFPRAEFARRGDLSAFIRAVIDIDEPLTIERGQTKLVNFRYRAGVPRSTAFSISWHETEEDADNLVNALQDEPLPLFNINPPSPAIDSGILVNGTVRFQAPNDMRLGIVYGAMVIYQP